ncbi:MAG: hypothetical protein Q7T01_04875 [bacterium]|nr:hypothetical protein [bacterium]
MSSTSKSIAQVGTLFQSAQASGALSPAGAASISIPDMGAQIQAGLGISVDDVTASEVFLVTVLLDDSGSIRFVPGNTEAVRDGYNGVLDALVASKQDDSILAASYLLNNGLLDAYGSLRVATRLDSHNFNPSGGTPLYERALEVLATVLAKTQEFADNGVPVRSATLLVTDGGANGFQATAAQVRALVTDLLRQECHIVAGMGVDDGTTDFRQVFREMGVRDEWILAPKNTPSEVRKAFGAFSRSAVRASQSAGSFSQTAVGGFAAP